MASNAASASYGRARTTKFSVRFAQRTFPDWSIRELRDRRNVFPYCLKRLVLLIMIGDFRMGETSRLSPVYKMTPRAGLKTGHYKTEGDCRFAPKASRRPSQSFTTNSRLCHVMLPSPRANSTPWAAYSA